MFSMDLDRERDVPTSCKCYRYTYKGIHWDAPKNSPSATQISPANPFENAAMKEPSGEIASSLDVVCYVCLDELSLPNCIKSTGFCKKPSHEKVLRFPLYVPLIITTIGCQTLGSAGVAAAAARSVGGGGGSTV